MMIKKGEDYASLGYKESRTEHFIVYDAISILFRD